MGGWNLEFRPDGVYLRHGDDETILEGKPGALFAYLAVEGPTTRRALSALLWPDSDAPQGRANLRKLLSRLDAWRGAFASEDPLALLPELAPPPWHPLPEDLGFDASSRFDDWLLEARERRRRDHIRWLRSDIQRLEEAGDAVAAMRSTARLAALDPSEATIREALARAGRLGDAQTGLEIYREHKERLAREFDAQPDPATDALARDLTVSSERDALTLLITEGGRLYGSRVTMALERLDAARPAWMAAWERAVSERDAASLADAADALASYLELRGEIHLAVTMLSQAHLSLEPPSTVPERRAAGRVLIHLAWHEQQLGLAAAEAHAERGLRLLPRGEESTYRARGLYALGLTRWARGDPDTASHYWDRAHDQIDGSQDSLRSALLRGNMAIAADAVGDAYRAKLHYRAAIYEFERRGEPVAALPYLNNLGQLLVDAGDVEDGTRLLERGIGLARANGRSTTLAYLLDSRARAAIHAGQLDAARAAYSEAFQLARTFSDRVLSAALVATEARLTIATAESSGLSAADVVGTAMDALRAAHELALRPAVLEALLLIAEALAAVGAHEDADRVLATVAGESGSSAAVAKARLSNRDAIPTQGVDALVEALLGS